MTLHLCVSVLLDACSYWQYSLMMWLRQPWVNKTVLALLLMDGLIMFVSCHVHTLKKGYPRTSLFLHEYGSRLHSQSDTIITPSQARHSRSRSPRHNAVVRAHCASNLVVNHID